MAQPGKHVAVDMLKAWFERDLGRFARWDRDVEILSHNEEGLIRIAFYTDTHRYQISAAPDGGHRHSYLGAIASNRKPRAGEDWCRGNDLADGVLAEETWRHILSDIVSYEMVRVHRESARCVTPDGGVPAVGIAKSVEPMVQGDQAGPSST